MAAESGLSRSLGWGIYPYMPIEMQYIPYAPGRQLSSQELHRPRLRAKLPQITQLDIVRVIVLFERVMIVEPLIH